MLQTQVVWAVGLAGVAVVVAAVAGFGTVRAQVLLVLVPALASSGLSGIRQVFYASYRTGRLGVIDVVTNAGQAVAVAVVALATDDAVAVAAAVSVMTVLNAAVVTGAGRRLIDAGRARADLRRRMLRLALPLGVSSVLATAYFTLDLTVVAFIVPGREVGFYAAATKVLSILVTLPALVVTAALPGVSGAAGDPAALGRLLGRLWHWLAVAALPACLGVIVFAPLVVRVFFGADFAPAVPLVRILATSGIVALLSNVFVTAAIALRRTTWLIVQSAAAVVANLVGNLVLVPRFGVTASAWLTVATEVAVCLGYLLALRGRVPVGPVVARSRAPLAAGAALLAVGVPLAGRPSVGIPAAALVFAVVLVGLGGWPEDLPAPWRRRVVAPGHP
jgi:O-antigen/teichoic acid export membrane protein